MSVWLTIPSKRPPEEAEKVLKLWSERGYKIALWLDTGWPRPETFDFCFAQDGEYPGYARSVNALVAYVASDHRDAEWFIAAGDDVEPDLNYSAEEISEQLKNHFSDVNHTYVEYEQPDAGVHPWTAYARTMTGEQFETFGVMQPTGDRWGDKDGPYIDRVAGSAWIGREFAQRVNCGKGPLWPEYFHMGVDEELQAVALKYGVFWQRPDLIHFHRHWGRPRKGEVMGQRARMPEFLERANSPKEWDAYKKLFAERKAAGFPGSELL
jgi:hypothetical protein